MARAVDFIAEVERNVHNVVWNFPRASFVKLKRIEGKFGINLKIIRMVGNTFEEIFNIINVLHSPKTWLVTF